VIAVVHALPIQGEKKMIRPPLDEAKSIGAGLAFILYPGCSAVAFIAHPNLLSLEVGGSVSARVAAFHGNSFLHFGHFVMLLGVPLLIVAALKLMQLARDGSAWLGYIGCAMSVFGAVLLAVDKTALCLVMSAFESVPQDQYQALLPGIEALFALDGYLAILQLLPMLAVGFLVQGIAVFRSRTVPRWQSGALIVSMLGMGVAAATDINLLGLAATGVLAVGFIPMGWAMIVSVRRTDARDSEPRPIVEPA
jgi:hypothetical protein